MSAHTPGPWAIDDGDGGALGVFGPDGTRICYLSENALRPNDGQRTPEEDLANARVLKAAPDLLEALRKIGCRASKVYLSGNVCADAPERERCFVCAAIAKAEGRS